MHGVWARGALCLWAEDPDLPRRAARPAAAPGAPSVRLPGRRAGRRAGRAARAGRRGGPQGGERRARAPAAFGRRAPSGRSPRPGSPGRRRRRPRPGPSLATWRVPVLALAPAAALDLLRVGPGRVRRSRAPRCPTWPRWPGSPTAWRRAAGCCRSWPPRTADTRPAGVRCSAAPTRSARVTWPRPCPRRAGRPAPTCPSPALDGLTDAAARARLPGSLLPARRGRTPAHIPLAERYVASLTSTDARLDVVTPPGGGRGGRAGRGAGRVAGPRTGTESGFRPGADLLPAGRTTRARTPIPGGSSSRCSPPRTRA